MRSFILIVAAALLTSSCQRGAPPAPAPSAAPAPWPLAVSALPSPAAGQSLAPQLTTYAGGAILSWLEQRDGTTTLRFTERVQPGWGSPVTVASGRNWFVSYADVPSVVRKADGTLVANWLVETDASIEAYDLLLSYSRDNGVTWAAPFSPHHDGTRTQHGFASFFELPGNALGLVWLDGRQQELDTTSPEGGAMSLRSATFDAAWKQTTDAAVDVRVCECCPTTAAVTSSGVITAFRDRSDGDVRDIRVSTMENGTWQSGPLVHEDGWVIAACPVNGPMLAARGQTVAVAWFTAKDDQGHAYAAFSTDAGRTWGPPNRLDDATALGHVDIELLPDGSAAATWVEFAGQRAQVKVRRIEPGGAKSPAVTVSGAGDGRPTGVPRLAVAGDELLLAWTENAVPWNGTDGAAGSRQQIKTAAARVPRATAVR